LFSSDIILQRNDFSLLFLIDLDNS
jgi:hypothetical protein